MVRRVYTPPHMCHRSLSRLEHESSETKLCSACWRPCRCALAGLVEFGSPAIYGFRIQTFDDRETYRNLFLLFFSLHRNTLSKSLGEEKRRDRLVLSSPNFITHLLSTSSSLFYRMPEDGVRPVFARSQSNPGFPAPPVTFSPLNDDDVMCSSNEAVLELNDGSAFRGISFGAEEKSVAGECVFQTGGVYFHHLMLCY